MHFAALECIFAATDRLKCDFFPEHEISSSHSWRHALLRLIMYLIKHNCALARLYRMIYVRNRMI